MIKIFWVTITFTLTVASQLLSQDNSSLSEAIKFSTDGMFEKADSILSELYKSDRQVDIARAKGYNYSWWGKHEKAIKIFKELLKKDPKDIESLLGLGYAHVYMSSYANAYYDFMNVLKQDPSNEEAQKGLAYKYMYEGNLDKSQEYFETLSNENPDNEEYKIALGKLSLIKKQNQTSLKITNEILEKSPNSNEAIQLKNEAQNNAAKVEFNIWGGLSKANKEYAYGLRAIEIQYLDQRDWKVGSRFDNSLATDNFRLFNRNLFAPTLWATSGAKLHDRIIINLDIGNRFLNGNTPLIRGELVYFGPYNTLLKSGYFSALRGGAKEYNLNIGVEIPILHKLRLGSTYFYGREGRLTKNTFRWLFSSKILVNAVTLDVGYFVGNNGLYEERPSNDMISGLFMITNVPIRSRFSWMSLINYENAIGMTNVVFATGLKYKLY